MSFWCKYFGIGCPKPTPPPTPTPPPAINTFDTYFNCSPSEGVTAELTVDDGSIYYSGGQQHVVFTHIPLNLEGWGGNLKVMHPNYVTQNVRVSVVAPNLIPSAVTLAPAMPAPPTRDQRGLAKLHFGGLYFNHSMYGTMPLFEACLAWLSAFDRQTLYEVKHAAGDTHLLVEVPAGVPLYDEPNQPYSPDRFGALDATSGMTGLDQWFVDIIVEAIEEGFIPILFLQEDYATSMKMIPLVINGLQGSNKGDLIPYVILSPGWDGIFYGWEPSHQLIPAWGALARATYQGPQGNLMLKLEFNPGHIPLGEGDADYLPGGNLKDFDVIAGEFSPWVVYGVPAGDTVWQIVPRMGCPSGYNRPADQPAWDDPNPPPYVLHDSSRGRRYGWVFETGMYEFNLGRATPEQLDECRRQYRAMGCETVC